MFLSHFVIKINKMSSYPLTTAYANFVKAGLVDHQDPDGKTANLPAYVKNESKNLSGYLLERLKNEFKKEIRRIELSEASELLNIPGYKGDKEPKVFLQEVLNVAKEENVEGASSALESKTYNRLLN